MTTISAVKPAAPQATTASWVAFLALVLPIAYGFFILADLIQNGNVNATLGWLFATINWVASLFPHAAPVVQHARIVVPS
jgi:hypothetical protein